MRFVIIDESTSIGNGAQYGGVILPSQGKTMADAFDMQLNAHLAPHWGGNYSVRWGSNSQDVAVGEIVCALMDQLPVKGAVAYHDRTGAAVPVVFLGRIYCSSISQGTSSVSSALSHELCEAAVDPFCNAWRDDGKGGEFAQEACDACQESGYTINGVSVSNFLLPAFFASGAQGPYDYLGTLNQPVITSPFDTMPGGYQLRRSAGVGETQVNGLIAPHLMAKKAHYSSRSARRGYKP